MIDRRTDENLAVANAPVLLLCLHFFDRLDILGHRTLRLDRPPICSYS